MYIKKTRTCEEYMFRVVSSLHLGQPCHFPSCNDYLFAALRKEDLKEPFSFFLGYTGAPGLVRSAKAVFAIETSAAFGTALSTTKTWTFCVSFALYVTTGHKSSVCSFPAFCILLTFSLQDCCCSVGICSILCTFSRLEHKDIEKFDLTLVCKTADSSISPYIHSCRLFSPP